MKYPLLLLLAGSLSVTAHSQFAIRPVLSGGYLAGIYTPRKHSLINNQQWKERTDAGAYFMAGVNLEKQGFHLPIRLTYGLNNTYREKTGLPGTTGRVENLQHTLNLSAGVGLTAETEMFTYQGSIAPGVSVFADRESNTDGYHAFPTLSVEGTAYRKYLGLRLFATAPLRYATETDWTRSLWQLGAGISYRFLPRNNTRYGL